MKKYNFTRYFLSLFICIQFVTGSVSAQNITGTWEGFMRDEYLQINIKQEGTSICGFTYDFVLRNKSNHCRAYYAGRFEDGMLLLTGTSFIENSGEHVLMTIGLLTRTIDGRLVLQGRVDTNTLLDSWLTDREAEVVTLKRVSKVPQNVPGTGAPCFNGKTPSEFTQKENEPIGSNPNVVVPTPVKPKQTPVTPKDVATAAKKVYASAGNTRSG